MESEEIDCIINKAQEYAKEIEEIEAGAPCEASLLSYLSVNENAHSAIIANILKYPDKSHILWRKFREYLGFPDGKQDFPIVYTEYTVKDGRIDVYLKAGDFHFIIENKAKGAGWQEKQLYKYIEGIKDMKVELDNIYIVVIVASKLDTIPSEVWGNSSLDYEKNFTERTKVVGLFDDIPIWIRSVIGEINNSLFVAYLRQYEYYLSNCSGMKKVEEEILNKMKDQLDGEDLHSLQRKFDRIQYLRGKLKDYETAITRIINLQLIKLCTLNLEPEKESYLPNLKNDESPDYPFVGVLISKELQEATLLIQAEDRVLYVGIGTHLNGTKNIDKENAKDAFDFKSLGIEEAKQKMWYGYQRFGLEQGSPTKAVETFKSCLERLKEKGWKVCGS